MRVKKPTPLQIQMIKYFRDQVPAGKSVKLEKLIEVFGSRYYANARKHVSDRVHRLYRSGWLDKEKRGYYKLGKGPRYTRSSFDIEDPDQLDLFS